MTKAQALAILINDLEKSLKNCKSKWNGHKPEHFSDQLLETLSALEIYLESERR